MNKENCALKLVDEIILYYDARSKKHQTQISIITIIIFIIIIIVIFIILYYVQNKPCQIRTYVCLLLSYIIVELTCSGWRPAWSGMQQLDALFRLLLTLQAS